MNENAFEIFDGIELPDNLLASITGGVLSEDDDDWARAMISAAKRLNWTIDQLIRKVEEILAYEHDEAEIERLNESLDFIRENW